jgi:transmembrane sensor
MNDYSTYVLEDFVMDSKFLVWVKNPDAVSSEFWDDFLVKFPEKKLVIEQAKEIIKAVNFNDSFSIEERMILWQQLQPVVSVEMDANYKSVKPLWFYRWNKAAAAVVIGLMLTGTSFFIYKSFYSATKIATQFGEIRKENLPDGSVITMNAHSEIKYKEGWGTKAKREIWLDGEAFFSVQHKQNNQPFVIHVGGMDIEVLGTEFNVFKRDGQYKVSLNTGKIKLTVPESSQQPLFLNTGELAEFLPDGKTVAKKTVNPANYSSWKDHKLVFDDTPLSDIMLIMKDTFGWEVGLSDSSLLTERLTGEIETKNELEFLNALSRAFNIKIDKAGNKITITRNQ